MLKISLENIFYVTTRVLISILVLICSYELTFAVSKKEFTKKDDLLRVYFIDTKRGESIFAQIGKYNVLIDTGPAISVTNLSKKHNKENIHGVMPFLNKLKIKKIDLLVISYVSRDYIGNLPLILEHITVSKVIDAAFAYEYPLYSSALEIIEKKSIAYNVAREGSSFKIGNDLVINVVSPSQDAMLYDKPYDKSVVLKLSYKSISFLLTGAVGSKTVEKLTSLASNFKHSFLKIPYNYKGEDNIVDLIKNIMPKAIYIPAKKYHIASKVLDYCKAYGIPVYSAFKNGTLLVETNGKEYLRP